MEDFFKVITPICIGFVSAFFGSRLALIKFKKEKDWERKEKAYSEIIDSLYDLLQHCEIHKENYGQGTGYSELKENSFREKYDKAFWQIKKVTDIGAFVISESTNQVLVSLRNREKWDWNSNPSFEIYESDYKYYKSALKEIVAIAKDELQSK